jgi:hypothetical protein
MVPTPRRPPARTPTPGVVRPDCCRRDRRRTGRARYRSRSGSSRGATRHRASSPVASRPGPPAASRLIPFVGFPARLARTVSTRPFPAGPLCRPLSVEYWPGLACPAPGRSSPTVGRILASPGWPHAVAGQRSTAGRRQGHHRVRARRCPGDLRGPGDMPAGDPRVASPGCAPLPRWSLRVTVRMRAVTFDPTVVRQSRPPVRGARRRPVDPVPSVRPSRPLRSPAVSRHATGRARPDSCGRPGDRQQSPVPGPSAASSRRGSCFPRPLAAWRRPQSRSLPTAPRGEQCRPASTVGAARWRSPGANPSRATGLPRADRARTDAPRWRSPGASFRPDRCRTGERRFARGTAALARSLAAPRREPGVAGAIGHGGWTWSAGPRRADE